MGRRASRKHAFILVYQSEFHVGLDAEDWAGLYLADIDALSEPDREFIMAELNGVFDNKPAIDKLIDDNLRGWSFERINKIDLALMRLAVYEMLFVEDIPVKVAINEAVELAKAYGGDESASFLNGMLGKISLIDRDNNND